METTWAFYYWIYMVLYKVHAISGPIAHISFVMEIIGLVFFKGYVILFPSDDIAKNFNATSKFFYRMFIYVTIPAIILSVIIPDKNDAKIMLALVGVETAVKNERVQTVTNKSVIVLEKYLDRLDKELR